MKYKYYLFYKKVDIDITNGSLPYAYTDTESVANLFIKQRNMHKFIYKKKNLTKEEVNSLAKCEMRSMLKIRNVPSKSKTKTGFTKTKIAITTIEETTVMSESTSVLYGGLLIKTKLNPEFFKKKVREYLSLINYDKYWATFNSVPFDDYYEEFDKDLHPDFLNIFILKYQDTLNH